MAEPRPWPVRRHRPDGPRSAGHDLRPPRYRLLQAAARIPQREPERPSVSFEMACPACGRTVVVTQTGAADGPAYRAEDHDCA